MGREFELKFRADAAVITAIREKYGSFTTISMETTYYDTPDKLFSNRRCTLRTRLENGKCICTLKTPAKKGRAEWEVEKCSIEEAAPELCKLAGLEVPDSLVPVCGAKFTRQAATLTLQNATVELALDKGVLLGGGKELPLFEIEIEYKSGDEQEAEVFAFTLAKELGLSPENKSKFRRAIELTAE